MKKIIIWTFIVFIIGFLLAFTKKKNSYLLDYFTKEEVKYIEDNDIDFNSIYPYLKYKQFNIYDYYSYEKIRLNNAYCNHLEALNLFYNKKYYKSYIETEPAIFINEKYMLVNKHYYLSSDYIPNNCDYLENYTINYIKRSDERMMAKKEALEAFLEMNNVAIKNNIELIIYSAYRSYEKQEYLYYVVNLSNDDYSAKPGYSEHQTGYAFDISDSVHGLTENFAISDNYQWLIKNAHLYGFILRYKKEKENLTLYKFEPWHFRYVGKSLASYMYNNNLCLEEFIIKNYEL